MAGEWTDPCPFAIQLKVGNSDEFSEIILNEDRRYFQNISRKFVCPFAAFSTDLVRSLLRMLPLWEAILIVNSHFAMGKIAIFTPISQLLQ